MCLVTAANVTPIATQAAREKSRGSCGFLLQNGTGKGLEKVRKAVTLGTFRGRHCTCMLSSNVVVRSMFGSITVESIFQSQFSRRSKRTPRDGSRSFAALIHGLLTSILDIKAKQRQALDN